MLSRENSLLISDPSEITPYAAFPVPPFNDFGWFGKDAPAPGKFSILPKKKPTPGCGTQSTHFRSKVAD